MIDGFVKSPSGGAATQCRNRGPVRQKEPTPPYDPTVDKRTLTVFRLRALCALFLLFMTGCAVGPNFQRPEAPPVTQYTHGQTPASTQSAEGLAQQFNMGEQMAADWWRLFNCPQMDELIKKAIAENWNLQAALARLRQSQEILRAGYGVFFPQVEGSFSATRQSVSSSSFGTTSTASATRGRSSASGFGTTSTGNVFNFYTATASITYLLDVFGGQRRAVESFAAQTDYQDYTARATYLTLLGNVVNAAIAQAGYRAEIQATEEIIAFEKEQLQITEAQEKAGTVPYSTVLSIRAQLAATEATLPALRQSLSQTEHLLTALVGSLPAEWVPPPLDLEDISLPVELPVTLPSQFVRQRPDILAAEAILHSSSANIGVATAALFPSVTLSGAYGVNNTYLSKLFEKGSKFWSMGVDVATPLLQGGTLWFQREAALQAYQASLADYKQVVVSAFQQVADALRALEHDAENLRAQSESLAVAKEVLALLQKNYQAGLVDYLQLLTADNQYQQARLGYIQARTLRLQDTAALFVSLGGGWWTAETMPADN
jgi:NodT family efflux transporter outer membrane factor (OMF) lipoprotein